MPIKASVTYSYGDTTKVVYPRATFRAVLSLYDCGCSKWGKQNTSSWVNTFSSDDRKKLYIEIDNAINNIENLGLN